MKITDGLIAEQKHVALDNLGGEVVGFRVAVERKLVMVGAPHVKWTLESGDTGFFRALAGNRLDFMRVEDSRFREYMVLISARSTGSLLHASWLVLVTPRLINDLRRAVRFDAGGGRFDLGAELDFLDNMRLNDFLAVTKLAFKTAIRELTKADHDEEELSELGPSNIQ